MFSTKLSVLILSLILAFSSHLSAVELKGHTCSLGLLPFGNTMMNQAQKNAIIDSYESKGFYVSLISNPNQISGVEFISDATVECTPTYYGTMAETTIRIIDVDSNIIRAKSSSSKVMDLFSCKVEVVKAVRGLPNCVVR